MGPFLSGGLFTLSSHVQPKGEALAWGVFGGIAFIGWLASFGIKGERLEDDDFDGDESSDDEEDVSAEDA